MPLQPVESPHPRPDLDVDQRCARDWITCAWAGRCPVELPPSSAMDQYRDLTMREDLYRLAAEDDCRDATATVRGHDDKITAF
jgi:hypothetical protein